MGLLKDILDGGPAKYSYYKSSLALVSICLILEIISGFLIASLYILKSKLSKIAPVMENTAKKIRTQQDVDGKENCDEVSIKSLLTSVSFVRNDTATLERQLTSAYKLCYAQELLSALKLAQDHSILCLKNNISSSRNVVSETNNDITDNGVTHIDSAPIDMESLSKTIQTLRTARKREAILLEAISMVRKLNTYDYLLFLQTALTYIFLALTFLNVFLVTFAVPRPDASPAYNDSVVFDG